MLLPRYADARDSASLQAEGAKFTRVRCSGKVSPWPPTSGPATLYFPSANQLPSLETHGNPATEP